MATETKAQKATVERVMHEFKHGELDSGAGEKVRNPKQAIAIALGEAGGLNRQTAQAEQEGQGIDPGSTRAALYAEATRKNIPGRSRMDKAALQKALEAR